MKYNDNGTYKDIYVKAFDTLPVGTEVDYDGETVPTGWEEVDDPNTYSSEEKQVGLWEDDNGNLLPLYRKVFKVPNIENVTSGNYTSISTGLTANENIVKSEGQLLRTLTNNKISMPLPTSDNSSQITYLFATNNTSLRVYLYGTNYSTETVVARIIAEYTKNSDEVGE